MTTPKMSAPPRKRNKDSVPGTSGVGIDAENAFPKSEIPEEPTTQDKPAKTPGRRGTTLKQPLMAMYGTIGFAVGMAGKKQLGETIMESAEQCAEAWDDLARQNASVKRVLEAMTKVTATGAIITAHIPIIMAVTAEYRPDIAERFLSEATA